jgi:hypothetical protein
MHRRIFAFLAGVLILVSCARAAEADSPVSLVITYRARPETRTAFRGWLAHAGGAQFAAWKQEAAFADFHILFSSFAATSTWDAVVILDFTHFSDTARWRRIEQRFPGGLSAEALTLAAPESASLADVISQGSTQAGDAAEGVYLIAAYEVLTDIPKYRQYAAGYTAPQMRAWLEAGALSAFALYLNQNPMGRPWDALLVLKYRDTAALGHRDEIKAKVRERLAVTDPVWKGWSKDKSAIRREFSIVVADEVAVAPKLP